MLTLSRQCRAMNRSLANVIFGGIAASNSNEDSTKGMSVTKTSIDEVVELLGNAESVVIVGLFLISFEKPGLIANYNIGTWLWWVAVYR